jgi:nucleotide-binding universal stress UspA family protein
MFENVTVGLKEGLPHAPLLELAKRSTTPGGKIHLVTLVRTTSYEDEPERLKKAERDLDRYAEALCAEGFEATHEFSLTVVAAAMDLLRIAEDRDADLLIIGLAKRTRVGKALMGSDAQRVLLGAPFPVLVTQLHG